MEQAETLLGVDVDYALQSHAPTSHEGNIIVAKGLHDSILVNA